MKFKKKPVVIDTELYTAGCTLSPEFKEAVKFDLNGLPYIKTLEGIHAVGEGDWIIKGVKGEFYPCKPDIFEMTYEVAEG